MKKIVFLMIIALIAAPVFAAGTLATEEIPVLMVIDKTVTLTVNPAQINLNVIDAGPGSASTVYQGFTGVTITHNFPVIVNALIVPTGPALGPLAVYKCALDQTAAGIPQNVAGWTAGGITAAATLPLNTPAPAPIGEIFYVGAAVLNVDLTYAPSSPAGVQVATVGITVSDNL